MSASEDTEKLVAAVLGDAPRELAIVLDAAALTCLGNLREFVARRRGQVIMTPHRGEMSRLTGLSAAAIADDPRSVAERVAREFDAVVVLKGTRTIIASPEHASIIFEGGNKGLATGGSGDVLAGLIAGICARGANPWTAAGWAVFVHGAAGQQAAHEIAEIGYLARDLIPAIPKLLAQLAHD